MRAVVCTMLAAGALGYAPTRVLRRVEAYAAHSAGLHSSATLADFSHLCLGFFRSNNRPVDYALFDALTRCVERLYPASAPPTAAPLFEAHNLTTIVKVCAF